MRSANPALNNNTFRNTRRVSGEQAMSIDGTVNKTALSLLLVMTSAIYTWNNPEVGLALFWPVTIFTFVLLMITIFIGCAGETASVLRDWRNVVTLISDDEDNNAYFTDIEIMASKVDATHPEINLFKIPIINHLNLPLVS